MILIEYYVDFNKLKDHYYYYINIITIINNNYLVNTIIIINTPLNLIIIMYDFKFNNFFSLYYSLTQMVNYYIFYHY